MGKRDPRVDGHIAKAADFAKPILGFIRETIHASSRDLDETLKWQSPTFTYKGKIVCGMAAFKEHARFGFRPGLGGASFRNVTSLDDLPPKGELAAMVKKAIAAIDSGVTPVRKPSTPKKALPIPRDFAAALSKKQSARQAFDASVRATGANTSSGFSRRRPPRRARGASRPPSNGSPKASLAIGNT